VAYSIDQIVLKIASRCNLNCSYCYIYNHEDHTFLDRPRLIPGEVYESILARMKEYCAAHPGQLMSIGFHGGEPLLVGVDRFSRLVDRARAVLGEKLAGIAVQTNCTLIDDRWASTLKRLRVGVSVSLDGPASVHDECRVDHAGEGSHADVVRGIKQLQQAGISPMVLCVVNPRRRGAEVYRHFRDLGIESMDFLLPDVSHDNKNRLYGKLGATPVGDYLVEVLDLWLEEDDPNVTIRLFQELFSRILGGYGQTDNLGNTGSSYLIVDTDGAIEANDALKVCGHGIASSGLNVRENGFDDPEQGLPVVHRAVSGGFPLPEACRACHERTLCGGGYLPHRYSRERGFDNPSVWCTDILQLVARAREYLAAEERLVS
jgi:uncharacterized protein